MEEAFVKEIVETRTGVKVQDVWRIENKGTVNEVYVVLTDSAPLVVRIDPNETTVDRFTKEAWCVEAAAKVGILVPKVVTIGLKGERPYMVSSYADGVVGDEASAEMQKHTWKVLGECARKLQSVPVKGFGERMTAPGVFDSSWASFLDYNISSLTPEDELLKRGIITMEQSGRLKAVFIRLQQESFKFGLIHYDLSLKNTIADNSGKVYLIDWGSAEVHVTPHMDIIEILHSSLKEESEEFGLFLEGLDIQRESFEAIKPQIRDLKLLTRTDKVRWAIDRRPEEIESMSRALKYVLAE